MFVLENLTRRRVHLGPELVVAAVGGLCEPAAGAGGEGEPDGGGGVGLGVAPPAAPARDHVEVVPGQLERAVAAHRQRHVTLLRRLQQGNTEYSEHWITFLRCVSLM